MRDSTPVPMQAQPAFADRRGLAPRAGPSFALDPLGRLPRRLDPSLAPQKSDNLQKSFQQTRSAGVAGAANLSGRPAATSSRAPAPAPWRIGGTKHPPEVEALADRGIRMYKIHRALGMRPEEAAAWAANAVAESRGDYRRPQRSRRPGGPAGPGYGLFQWGSPDPRLDRRPAFKKVFGHPIQQSSEREQLQFRDWELAHSYPGLARQLARASSAGDMAAAITHIYEGPADWPHIMIDRANIAEAIMRRAREMPNVVDPNAVPGDPWRRGITASGSGQVR